MTTCCWPLLEYLFPRVKMTAMSGDEVCFPDVERAEWLNQIIAQMWPFISSIVTNILKEKVEPEIQKKLPSIIKSFEFVEVDLGNRPLKFGGVKVYTKHVQPNEIIIDAEILYAGDADLKVGIHGVTAGISDIQLRGTIRIEIKPLLGKLPLVGAITIYFLETPDFNFDLTNLLNVFDIPGLSDIIRKILSEVMESFIVLPNRITVPIGHLDDLDSIKYSLPMGALRVRILEAENIEAHDTNLFKKDSSDPYVVCKIDSFKYQTKVLNSTLNPKWKDESFITFVHALIGTQMNLQMFDSDSVSDDLIGRASVDLAKLSHYSSLDSWLPLKEASKGKIHIQTEWFNFSSKSEDLNPEMFSDSKPSACVFIKLEHGKDLPAVNMSEDTCSSFVEITVGNVTVTSKTQRNTNSPVWEELHSFFVTNPNLEKINFKVMDKDAEEPLGTLDYPISNLISAPAMTLKQSFSLLNCFTDGKLFMTLELKAFTPPTDTE